MKTCGDIDGKQCEFFSPKEWDIGDRECVSRDSSCPRKYEGTTSSTRACAPMLALIESRARVAELESRRMDVGEEAARISTLLSGHPKLSAQELYCLVASVLDEVGP